MQGKRHLKIHRSAIESLYLGKHSTRKFVSVDHPLLWRLISTEEALSVQRFCPFGLDEMSAEEHLKLERSLGLDALVW